MLIHHNTSPTRSFFFFSRWPILGHNLDYHCGSSIDILSTRMTTMPLSSAIPPNSRLLVRNIPPTSTNQDVRKHFLSIPDTPPALTDVLVLHKPDGTSRRLAFVGFRSVDEATRAKEYFNGTMFHNSKILVDYSRPPGKEREPGNPGAGAMAGKDVAPAGASTAISTTGQKGKRQPTTSESAQPPRKRARGAQEVTFDEFFAVMAPKSKRRTWANEEAPAPSTSETPADSIPPADDDEDADMQDLTGLNKSPSHDAMTKEEEAVRKAAQREAKRTAKAAQQAIGPQSETIHDTQQGSDEKMDEEGEDVDEDVDDSDAEDAGEQNGLTDAEWLASRMKYHIGQDVAPDTKPGREGDSDSDAGAASDSDADADDAEVSRAAERAKKAALKRADDVKKEQEAVDLIMSSARVFVRNLPFTATEDELLEHFSQCGPVSVAQIPLDRKTKQSKGIAFVLFQRPDDALRAFRELEGTTFQGRVIHVDPAANKSAPGLPEATNTAKLTLKQQRLAARQRAAAEGRDAISWGSLYMDADAVAASVSQRLGISKADLVNPEDDGGTSAGVRLALAETKAVQETKDYFKAHGVDLGLLAPPPSEGKNPTPRPRDPTWIMVKNLTFGTTEEDLRKLFSRHGDVAKILLPPTGTLALVKMPVLNEARAALRSLAYTRFKDKPLYLEQAPRGLLSGPAGSQSALKGKEAPASSLAAKFGTEDDPNAEEGGQADTSEVEAGATLFVKNLSFATTDDGLKSAFKHLSGFLFARVQTKAAPPPPPGRQRTGPARLSMGFGFIGFRSVEQARSALESMQGATVDGHALSLKFSKQDAARTIDSATYGSAAPSAAASKGKAGRATILVKNLPFQATKREVRQLFQAQGEVAAVRMPTKLDRSARGFAFVEFVSRRAAASAMDALAHTHFLGRHLVLSWADTDPDAAAGGVGATASHEDKARARQKLASTGSAPRRQHKLHLTHEDVVTAAAQERARAEDDSD